MFSGGFGGFRRSQSNSNTQDDNFQFNDWNSSTFSNPLGTNNVFANQIRNPLSTSNDNLSNPFSSMLQGTSFGNMNAQSLPDRMEALEVLNEKTYESSESSSDDETNQASDLRSEALYRDNLLNETVGTMANGKSSGMNASNSAANNNINQIILLDLDIDQYVDIKNVVVRSGKIFISRKNGFDVYDEEGLLIRKYDIGSQNFSQGRKPPARNQISLIPVSIVDKIFVDPEGIHVLITCEDSQTYYVNVGYKEPPKLLSVLGAVYIESVGWKNDDIAVEDGISALVGTKNSRLYNLEIRTGSEPVTRFECVFDFNGKTDVEDIGPILSINVQQAPPHEQEDTYVVLVCTGQILFYFVGGPDFPTLFDAYTTEQILTYKEFPLVSKSKKEISQLVTFANYGDKAESFAWLCHAGIVHGPFDYTDLENGMNPIPDVEIIKWDQKEAGVSIAITAYHIFVLTEEKLLVYMLPSHFVTKAADGLEVAEVNFSSIRKVYEKVFDKKVEGTPKGLCYDESNGEVYLYTNTSVTRINMEDEEKDVWKLFLSRAIDSRTSKPHYFSMAKSLTKDASQLDIVNTERANYLFNQGKFMEAAVLYNSTTKPFEEICMKFANKNEWDALRKYLLEKLDFLKSEQETKKDPNFMATQLTCITAWLTELYITKIDTLSTEERRKNLEILYGNGKKIEIQSTTTQNGKKLEKPEKQEKQENIENQDLSDQSENSDSEEEVGEDIEEDSDNSQSSHNKISELNPLQLIREEFHDFLKDNETYLNKNKMATFRIIESHAHMEEIIFYAELTNEFKRVISDHIVSKNYERALNILDNRCKNLDSKAFFPLVYTFAPILMQHLPKETVNMLMKKKFLDPSEMIPALMKYKSQLNSKSNLEVDNYIVEYLHWCIVICESKDPSIHNLLLLMYVQLEENDKLLAFLETEPHYYNEKYALRLCQKEGKMAACVQLLMSMESYEEAVKLALDHNEIELAKECAERSFSSENYNEAGTIDSRQKALWLMIAEHIIKSPKANENNLQVAISFLDSTDVLKLEDILPLFPDFKQIKNFRDIIVKCLEDHNSEIQTLKEQMEDTNDASALARSDINQLKHRCNIIMPTSRCASFVCRQLCLSQDIYMFPCGHFYHIKCLISDLRRVASHSTRQSIDALLAQMKNKDKRIEAQLSLDKIISAECPLCSDYFIDTVDTKFINSGDAEAKTWTLHSGKSVDDSDSEGDVDLLSDNSDDYLDISDDSF